MIEPNRAVTVEPLNPSSPSLGPDPLAFWNKVMPFSSKTQICDPRSMAVRSWRVSLPVTMCRAGLQAHDLSGETAYCGLGPVDARAVIQQRSLKTLTE